jgi:hypothetical protein
MRYLAALSLSARPSIPQRPSHRPNDEDDGGSESTFYSDESHKERNLYRTVPLKIARNSGWESLLPGLAGNDLHLRCC